MKNQNNLIYLTIGAIIILAILMIILPKSDPDPDIPALPSEQSAPQQNTQPDNTQVEGRGNDLTKQNGENTQPPSEKVLRVRQLLDDENAHQEALKLAIELSTGNEEERTAALEVFQWVGGKESINALIPMLKKGTESAKNADLTLKHLIQQNMFEDSTLVDTDTWMEIINSLDSNEAIDEYLTLLTSFDVKEAVPVLLRLFDSENPTRQKQAKEYMEFVSGGETFTSKEQATAWFEAYQKEHQEDE
ncbi:MAG: hypothetical protein J6X55_11725 [Victivallales bacterium]|nr:hypothetical protein [Victivallales bacterium]